MATRIQQADRLAPEDLARGVSLRYVQDDVPGIRRRRAGRGFVYTAPSGRVIRNLQTKERVASLAIPPAWRDVWICPWRNGHIQATGRDDRDRKQYIYHPRWREAASQVKFARLHSFGLLLPKIRLKARRDLNGPPATRERLLAGMLQLLDAALLRVGNEEYTLQNGSYGLTTLCKKHVHVNGTSVSLKFQAKGGQKQRIEVEDALVAEFLRECRGAASRSRLFCYRTPDGQHCEVRAEEFNEYLASLSGADFTAKDFRTWKGTCVAAWRLFEHCGEPAKTRRKKLVLEAIDAAADLLGNTRSVCRAHYVHPEILEAYEAGRFPEAVHRLNFRRMKRFGKDEQLTLHLLERLQD